MPRPESPSRSVTVITGGKERTQRPGPNPNGSAGRRAQRRPRWVGSRSSTACVHRATALGQEGSAGASGHLSSEARHSVVDRVMAPEMPTC